MYKKMFLFSRVSNVAIIIYPNKRRFNSVGSFVHNNLINHYLKQNYYFAM